MYPQEPVYTEQNLDLINTNSNSSLSPVEVLIDLIKLSDCTGYIGSWTLCELLMPSYMLALTKEL